MVNFCDLLDNYLDAKRRVEELKAEYPNIQGFSDCFHGEVNAMRDAREALNDAYNKVVREVSRCLENPNA